MLKCNKKYMDEAIQQAINGVSSDKGGPFGCLIVKNGRIVGRGCNQVTSTNDPSAHAEIVAIRDACKNLDTYQLEGCDVYTSCEPCPMCLGAIYWARPNKVYYAVTKEDAAAIGFDDAFIYKEINKKDDERKIYFKQCDVENMRKPFSLWSLKENKKEY